MSTTTSAPPLVTKPPSPQPARDAEVGTGAVLPDPPRQPMLVLVFGLTLFVSAFLLFLVQPMVGKMILPSLGGTPAVWNTCMLFFQAALLIGYAYVHATTSWLGVRRQMLLHAALLFTPLIVLPIVISYSAPSGGSPVFWLLGRLAITVGLPFFVVATSAPLLQKWFAQTGHAAAKDPYFLYAASNTGSLLALLGYPVVIEPLLGLSSQSHLWSIGYAVLIALILACALTTWIAFGRRQPASATSPSLVADCDGETSAPPVTNTRRLWWIFTAFVPSSLMLGVTTHITTNLAAIPLLWVLPLALYLLTFVVVFSRRPVLPHAWMVRSLPFLAILFAFSIFSEIGKLGWMVVPIHLVMFFIAAMVCHGELARSRPGTRHLTEFYLLMSVGGVLGGIFNAIIAPSVFNVVAEYPLAMVLACLARRVPHQDVGSSEARRKDFTAPLKLAAFGAAVLIGFRLAGKEDTLLHFVLLVVVCTMVCFAFKDRPVRFALGLGVVFVILGFHYNSKQGSLLLVERNFFGVKKVLVKEGGLFRGLVHGNTYHGLEHTDPAKAGEPLAYYHRKGPVGDIFDAFSGGRAKQNVAVIGLGTGSMAAYAEPGQRFTFYEIDPAVVRIAEDPSLFTFLSRCRADYEVIVGDGRLTLLDAEERQFGMMIFDAFSSDAIPAHLLTLEALELYLSRLKEDGVLVFHISNRFLRLEPVLANLARELGLVCRSRCDEDFTRDEMGETGRFPSHYVVLARQARDLGPLADDPEWPPAEPDPSLGVWTDQYSNILSLFSW